ncbi:MAG: hypothetical protein EBZ75_13670 [Oxalobacteraceae bacterium]|nr:hypothetical protein [Oxalobacteraceae bacterium]
MQPSAYVTSCCGGNEAKINAILQISPVLAAHIVKPAFENNWPREGVHHFVCVIIAFLGRATDVSEIEGLAHTLENNLQTNAQLVQRVVCAHESISSGVIQSFFIWNVD